MTTETIDTPVAAAAQAPRYRFTQHDRIAIGGVDYAPRKSDQFGHTLARVDLPELKESFTHVRIAELLASGELVVYPGWYTAERAERRNRDGETRLLSELSDEAQRTIQWRLRYCEEFLSMELRRETTRSQKSMKRAITVITATVTAVEVVRQTGTGRCGTKVEVLSPPSPSQMRRWLKTYVGSGMDPMSLRDGRRRGGNRKPRQDADSADMVAEYVRRYASLNKPTMVMVYKDYCDAVDAANARCEQDGAPPLTKIGRRTFERRIGRLDPFFVCAGREGEEAALRRFAIVHRGLRAVRPLQRIEMDEWKVTLHSFLMDAGLWDGLSEKAKALVRRSRMWMTAVIDCATECVLALRFLEAAPSAESALSALEMAVFGMADIATVAGAETPCEMAGTPETVATDSGAGFIAAKYLSAVHDIGARDFRPPAGMPWLRGRIERFFATAQTQLMRRFPGQTFENILVKGDYDAEGNACLNIEELNRVFVRYVVDIYHNTPHSGLAGETPRNAWNRLVRLYGVKPPPSPDIRRHVFGLAFERQIGNRGIRVLGLHYQSPQLQKLRGTVGQKPVLIRVDRYDLGSISVRVGEGWMSVPCVFPEMAGASWWEWIAATEDLHRRHADMAALAQDVVLRAVTDVRGTAEMAAVRAELGTPVLTEEAFKKVEHRLFRSFAFAGTGGEPDADLLGADASSDEVDTDVLPTAQVGGAWTPDDGFGGDDDWRSED